MDKRNGLFAVGLLSLIAAASNELFGGERPTGRSGLLLGPVFDALGQHGLSVMWLIVGALFLVNAWFSGKK